MDVEGRRWRVGGERGREVEEGKVLGCGFKTWKSSVEIKRKWKWNSRFGKPVPSLFVEAK